MKHISHYIASSQCITHTISLQKTSAFPFASSTPSIPDLRRRKLRMSMISLFNQNIKTIQNKHLPLQLVRYCFAGFNIILVSTTTATMSNSITVSHGPSCAAMCSDGASPHSGHGLPTCSQRKAKSGCLHWESKISIHWVSMHSTSTWVLQQRDHCSTQRHQPQSRCDHFLLCRFASRVHLKPRCRRM